MIRGYSDGFIIIYNRPVTSDDRTDTGPPSLPQKTKISAGPAEKGRNPAATASLPRSPRGLPFPSLPAFAGAAQHAIRRGRAGGRLRCSSHHSGHRRPVSRARDRHNNQPFLRADDVAVGEINPVPSRCVRNRADRSTALQNVRWRWQDHHAFLIDQLVIMCGAAQPEAFSRGQTL